MKIVDTIIQALHNRNILYRVSPQKPAEILKKIPKKSKNVLNGSKVQ